MKIIRRYNKNISHWNKYSMNKIVLNKCRPFLNHLRSVACIFGDDNLSFLQTN